MKNVLVTGANGFVGRAVCIRLLKAGWNVRAAIRSHASGASLPAGVHACLLQQRNGALCWRDHLGGMDAVVHLIARTHQRDQRGHALDEYRRINVGLTRDLLDACCYSSVRRFLFVSSIKAVGEGKSEPYRETDECLPQDAYGVTKREAELVVLELSQASNIKPVIVRPPLVYGANVRGNFLRLMHAVVRGIPLPVPTSSNGRSIICVDNLADAVSVCLEQDCAGGEIFHVADAVPISTVELIRVIAECAQRRARLLPVPSRLLHFVASLAGKGPEVHRLVGSLTVSTEKIRQLLRWQPPISTIEGVHIAVADYIQNYSPRNVRAA